MAPRIVLSALLIGFAISVVATVTTVKIKLRGIQQIADPTLQQEQNI
jgi:hypothetical protein